jgi:DNA-binding NarL/FixJ family response regulator
LSAIRIVVLDTHRMFGELIQRVFAASELDVETHVVRDIPAVAVAEEYQPDLLIAAVDDPRVEQFDEVFAIRPMMTVLAVVGDGRQSFLYRLRPIRERLGELSPETLLSAVRGLVVQRA